MKPVLTGILVAVVSLLSSVDTSFALSNNFTCGTGPISTCKCSGSKDCRGMRTSGMCSGPMVCNATGCRCLVVGIAGAKHKPGGGASGVSAVGTAGMAPVNAPSKPRQSAPTRQFKPLLPIAGARMK